MRIGIFSDTYHPATNGIVFVIDIIRQNLEELGHTVYVFAPEPRVRHWLKKREHHVVRFPAVDGIFFDEQSTSFFFPPTRLRKIKSLNLDAVLIMTPSQLGMMGTYAALGDDLPLFFQYSTDLISYIKQYPAVIPGIVALTMSAPFALRLRPKEVARTGARMVLRRNHKLTWQQDVAAKMLTTLYDRCNALIAVSSKTAAELRASGTRSPIVTVPTGVDKLMSDTKSIKHYRHTWGADDETVVCLYVGRLGVEKNLDLLIRAFAEVIKKNKKVLLVMVGGFSYRDNLEELAERKGITEYVRFVGRVPRERLGSIYEAADIFCFPSLTDTQALVLNEAAHAGLPLLWCDNGLNSVLVNKISGLRSKPNVTDFSSVMLKLINSHDLRIRYGRHAKGLAQKMGEQTQAKELVEAIRKYS